MSKRIFIIFFCLVFCSGFSENKKFFIKPSEIEQAPNMDLLQKNNNLDNAIEKEFPQIEYKSAFLKMLLSLVAVVTLGIITIISFKKIARNRLYSANLNNEIKILEKRILSPKSILYLIEYDGKKLIVSESHLDMKIKKLD